jgi:hypothetical protein
MKILAMLLFLGIFNGCTNQMDATKVYFVSEQTEIKNSSKLKVNNLELSKDIQAFISIENPNIRLQEPVILNFLVTNNLAEAIKLDLGADRKEAFLFWIVKPYGRKTQLPNFRGEDITRTGIVSIESQQTFSQRLLLNQWIQFSTPGRYILEGRLPESVIIGNKRTIKTDFNFNLTLNVGSEDKEHLKEISEVV